MISNLTEKEIQARLMKWSLDDKNHIMATPNITNVFWWECDLLTMTRAGMLHEFEIKRSTSDYQAEFKNKIAKHDSLEHRSFYINGVARIPNYYWFATADIDIDPPEYAGWIKFVDLGNKVDMWIKKDAPRLHKQKINQRKIDAIYRVTAYRLKDEFWHRFVQRKNK